MTTNENTEETSARSAGRGMLVDGVSEEKRAEMAVELAAEIREKRRTEWNPERVSPKSRSWQYPLTSSRLGVYS